MRAAAGIPLEVDPLALGRDSADVPLLEPVAGAAMKDVEAGGNNDLAKVRKRSMIMSILTLCLSIPALIGG